MRRQTILGGNAGTAKITATLALAATTAAVLLALGYGDGGGDAWAAKRRKQAAPAKKATYGPFSVENWASVNLRLKPTATEAILTGNKVRARSTLYDADAQRITFNLARFGKPARQKLTDSVATGGVRIVVRNPEAGRETTVTCDRAVYKASPNPADRGRIDLTGNIRAVIRDPATVGPSVLTAKTGYIDLIGPEETNVVLTEGAANATIKEPPPKPAPRRRGP